MRWRISGLLIGVGLVAVAAYGVVSDAVRADWFHDTAPLAEWLVALGTIGLAAATYRLARGAADEVRLQREHMERETHPAVYPRVTYEWTNATGQYDGLHTRVLPLKNGGPGLALNVHGAVYLRPAQGFERHSIDVAGSTIAAHEELDGRLDMPVPRGWEGVEGFIVYDDTSSREWVTHFRLGQSQGGRIVCFHEPPARVEDVGDPRRRYRPLTA